nr:MAG TPA: hypothetical protein [Caudoviricetes sp.]
MDYRWCRVYAAMYGYVVYFLALAYYSVYRLSGLTS